MNNLLKKVLLLCFFTICLLIINATNFYANQVSVYVNNSYVVSDQPPIIENGRTLIPLRAVGESLDCQVQWNSFIKKVSLTKSDTLIVLYIGNQNTYVYRNGKESEHYLDSPPCIVNSRTMVPLRFVSEILGYNVEWDGNTKTVYISENNTYNSSADTDLYDNSYNESSFIENMNSLKAKFTPTTDEDRREVKETINKINKKRAELGLSELIYSEVNEKDCEAMAMADAYSGMEYSIDEAIKAYGNGTLPQSYWDKLEERELYLQYLELKAAKQTHKMPQTVPHCCLSGKLSSAGELYYISNFYDKQYETYNYVGVGGCNGIYYYVNSEGEVDIDEMNLSDDFWELYNSIDTELEYDWLYSEDFSNFRILYNRQKNSYDNSYNDYNYSNTENYGTEDYDSYGSNDYDNEDYDSYDNEDYDSYDEEDSDYEDSDTEDYYMPTNEEIVYMSYEALNSYRDENGISQLALDSNLCKAAQKHAEDMAENNYCSHTSQDGRSPYDRAHEMTEDYDCIGENIANSGGTPHDIVYILFAESEGHNENMLDDEYTAVGIGYCNGYWVQLFGG